MSRVINKIKAFKAGVDAAEITSLLATVNGNWAELAENIREDTLDKLTLDLPKLDSEGANLSIEINANRIVVDYYTRELAPFGGNWEAVNKEMLLINKILKTAGLKTKYKNDYYNQRGSSTNPYMEHQLVLEIIPVKNKRGLTDEELDKQIELDFRKPSWNEMSNKNRDVMMSHISRVLPRIPDFKVTIELANIWSSQYDSNPWQTVIDAELQTGDDKEKAKNKDKSEEIPVIQ